MAKIHAIVPPFKRSGTTITQRTASDSLDLLLGPLHLSDDTAIGFGNTLASPDASIAWNTVQTVDALYVGLSAAQNTMIIGEHADIAYDFAHGAQTNPTLFIQSAAQSATEFVKLNAGVLSFGLGIAVTATDYSIGRDADATPQLHLNAPTGAGIELSINDTAQLALTSTGATFSQRIFASSNGLAFPATSFIYSGASPDDTTSGIYFVGSGNANVNLWLGTTHRRSFVIGDALARGGNFDHPAQSQPTLFLHSVTNPEADNRQFGNWYVANAGDGYNTYHTTGTGGHRFGFEALADNGTLTFTDQPLAGESFVINATTFTEGVTWSLGGTLSLTLDAIVTAINASVEAYTAHKYGSTVVIEKDATGAVGQVFTEAMTNCTASGAGVFTGGRAFSGLFDLQPGQATIVASTPIFGMKDTDTTDYLTDTAAQMFAQATDTGSGTEDIDVTFQQQVAGTMTTYLNSDADGNLALGRAGQTIAVPDAGGTKYLTFAHDGTDGAIDVTSGDVRVNDALIVSRLGTAAAPGEEYNSNVLILESSTWETTGSTEDRWQVRLYADPGAGVASTNTLKIASSVDGAAENVDFSVTNSGNIIARNNSYASGGLFATSASIGVILRGNDANDGSAVGTALDNAVTLSTAGGKLVSIRNNTAEKAYVDYLGSFNAGPGTALLPAYSFVADPNTGIWNLGADSLGFVTGGVTRATLTDSSLALTGTLTGITTALTGTINTGLTISVPNQGVNTNNGVGIIIQADDGGTGTTGGVGGSLTLRAGDSKGTDPHVGGDIILDTGLNVGASRRGFVELKFNNTDFGWIIPGGVGGTTLGLAGTDADGATAVGIVLGAYNDLTNASALIASFRDNISSAGGTQKAAIDLDGKGIFTTGSIQVKRAVTDIAGAVPTDAELDTAFGDPTVVGSGFIGILDDADGGTATFICWTTGTAAEWFYVAGTKAV